MSIYTYKLHFFDLLVLSRCNLQLGSNMLWIQKQARRGIITALMNQVDFLRGMWAEEGCRISTISILLTVKLYLKYYIFVSPFVLSSLLFTTRKQYAVNTKTSQNRHHYCTDEPTRFPEGNVGRRRLQIFHHQHVAFNKILSWILWNSQFWLWLNFILKKPGWPYQLWIPLTNYLFCEAIISECISI